MVEMTGEERKVANFLTKKKFRYKFQPMVGVKDLRNMPRLFNPDFYLTDLNIYIEVCGTERNGDYERRDKIYKKEEIPIIFVETYKGEDKWKHYLLQRIKEIQERRQSAVATITSSQPKVEEGTKKPNYEKISAEITSHIKEIETHKISDKPKPKLAHSKKEYFKSNVVSKQSQVGIIVILLGVLFIIITIIIFSYNLVIGLIMAIVGLFMFYLGFHIISYRFSRWFRNWLKATREKFRTWLQK